jgi:DNA-binding CsgD family transcriptional regulator
MWEKGLDIFGNLSILSRETLLAKYPNLSEVIAQRSIPGILIFTASGELVYINPEAHEVLTSFGMNGSGSRQWQAIPMPETLTNLCNQLNQLVKSYKSERPASELTKTPTILTLSSMGTDVYSFRAFFLSNNSHDTSGGAYILILVERVSTTKKMNIQKAAKTFKLSKREIDVLELVVLGLKNKEIAERLCVCVYTVEDHIKKIMKKVQVGNRTSIIAKLLED